MAHTSMPENTAGQAHLFTILSLKYRAADVGTSDRIVRDSYIGQEYCAISVLNNPMNKNFRRLLFPAKMFSILWKSFVIVSTSIIWIACSHYTYTVDLPAPIARAPHHELMAGAASVDITPFPIYPMGGFGIGGKYSRGVWSRLYANAIYLEDTSGVPVVLVSCDLWSMPAGLADKVSERLSKNVSTQHIGRANLIFAATHTHASPGCFSSSEAYNGLAVPGVGNGVDVTLVDFLVDHIAAAVIAASDSARPATAFVDTIRLPRIARNRSMKPFRKDREEDSIILANKWMPDAMVNGSTITDADAYRATDPILTVISLYEKNVPLNASPFAVAAFKAVHPTALGEEVMVFSSDIFGVAAMYVRQHFEDAAAAHKPVVALFNGTEGDQSPDWDKQGRASVVRLSKILATGILGASAKHEHAIAPTFSVRFDEMELADQVVEGPLGNDACLCKPSSPARTASDPVIGPPAMGGAMDGRTFLFGDFFHEGTRRSKADCDPTQGVKLMPGDEEFKSGLRNAKSYSTKHRTHRKSVARKNLRFRTDPSDQAFQTLLAEQLYKFVNNTMVKGKGPAQAPIGMYELGDLRLCTIPAEATTVMGVRIREAAAAAAGKVWNTVNIGLANEYVSYVTTPCEYDEQFYEGASTVYGQAEGNRLVQAFERLAAKPANEKQAATSRHYDAGPKTDFALGNSAYDAGEIWDEFFDATNDPITADKPADVPNELLLTYTWFDTLPCGSPDKFKRATPRVRIEDSTDHGWEPLRISRARFDQPSATFMHLEDDAHSADFVTSIEEEIDGKFVEWQTVWMCPTEMVNAAASYRFVVETVEGATKISDVRKLNGAH